MASAWGKIEPVVAVDFQEIMSEQYARVLQDKESGSPKPVTAAVETPKEEATASAVPLEMLDDPLPQSVLDAICQGGNEVCQSDEMIAQMLQAQFDLDHDDELKRLEKSKNKNQKVSISYEKYKVLPGQLGEDDDDSEDYDDDEYDGKDWDRFDTNEKKFESMPTKGFKLDEEFLMVTKHDERMCSVRNACKMMSFPAELSTGDAAGSDIRLSNRVFNNLRRFSKKIKKHKASDRKENVATAEMGIDEPIRLLLYKLINQQVLERVNGVISTGKEAVILHADADINYSGELNMPKECAIKIFKTTLNEFKQRDRYIKDDYRFKDRFSKQNNRVVINMWAEKEMHNLMRMQKCGIKCPEVIILKKNVLVMSFVGEKNMAAPKLKDVQLSVSQLSLAYEEVLDAMHKLYNEANLVHADLSEYNILYYEDCCWFIDVAQAVEPSHPSALEFLMRDCNNIVNFFSKRGLSGVKTKEELFSSITGLDPSTHTTAMLERIHTKGATAHAATLPDPEDVPDELKPLSYPFDTAWDKSIQLKEDAEASALAESASVLTVN